MNENELADRLGVTRRTIRRWRRRGCPHDRRGRYHLYDLELVQRWLDSKGLTGRAGRPDDLSSWAWGADEPKPEPDQQRDEEDLRRLAREVTALLKRKRNARGHSADS